MWYLRSYHHIRQCLCMQGILQCIQVLMENPQYELVSDNRDVFCTIARSSHLERMGGIITPLPNHLPHVAPLLAISALTMSLRCFRNLICICFLFNVRSISCKFSKLFPFQNHNRWPQSGEVNAPLSRMLWFCGVNHETS